jgi:tRNA threonylcarbamoyladenosine biosynthesis protein TsaB
LYDGGLITERSLFLSRAHSSRLLKLVHDAMCDVGAGRRDISAVAVSAGPGSFTGLRIGMATAKGLAFGWGCALVPVPTLDALALTAVPWEGPICTALTAKTGLVYAALYDGMTGRCTSAPCCLEEQSLASLAANTKGNVLLLGDLGRPALDRVAAVLERVVVPPDGRRLPRAFTVCALADEMIRSRGGVSPIEARPVYLRASEAEVSWKGRGKTR